jgi:hypothetical protein
MTVELLIRSPTVNFGDSKENRIKGMSAIGTSTREIIGYSASLFAIFVIFSGFCIQLYKTPIFSVPRMQYSFEFSSEDKGNNNTNIKQQKIVNS